MAGSLRNQRSTSNHQRQLLRQRAQRLRHEMTRSERHLWQVLRCSQLGVAFRRQVVLQGYVADFYACSVKLIVEVDGSWHDSRARADARRDRILAAAGYRVLRFTDAEVVSSLPEVVQGIRAAIGRGA